MVITKQSLNELSFIFAVSKTIRYMSFPLVWAFIMCTVIIIQDSDDFSQEKTKKKKKKSGWQVYDTMTKCLSKKKTLLIPVKGNCGI